MLDCLRLRPSSVEFPDMFAANKESVDQMAASVQVGGNDSQLSGDPRNELIFGTRPGRGRRSSAP